MIFYVSLSKDQISQIGGYPLSFPNNVYLIPKENLLKIYPAI